MELFQLRYAVTLLECCNFSRAAEKLYITQPTLSVQIQRLEKELGFLLFLRDTRKIVPTPAGKRFLLCAKKLLQEYEKLQEEAKKIHEMLEYQITFGTSLLSSPFIVRAVPLFLEEFPQTDLKMIDAHDPELIDMVAKGELDLAIVSLPYNHGRQDELYVIPIEEEYACVVVKEDHPLAARAEASLEQIIQHRLVFYSPKDGLRKMVFEEFEAHGLAAPVTMELTSFEAQAALINDGVVGFAFSEQKTWHTYKNFVRVPIEPRIYSTFALILPKGKKISRVLEGLIQHVAIKKSGKIAFN